MFAFLPRVGIAMMVGVLSCALISTVGVVFSWNVLLHEMFEVLGVSGRRGWGLLLGLIASTTAVATFILISFEHRVVPIRHQWRKPKQSESVVPTRHEPQVMNYGSELKVPSRPVLAVCPMIVAIAIGSYSCFRLFPTLYWHTPFRFPGAVLSAGLLTAGVSILVYSCSAWVLGELIGMVTGRQSAIRLRELGRQKD